MTRNKAGKLATFAVGGAILLESLVGLGGCAAIYEDSPIAGIQRGIHNTKNKADAKWKGTGVMSMDFMPNGDIVFIVDSRNKDGGEGVDCYTADKFVNLDMYNRKCSDNGYWSLIVRYELKPEYRK